MRLEQLLFLVPLWLLVLLDKVLASHPALDTTTQLDQASVPAPPDELDPASVVTYSSDTNSSVVVLPQVDIPNLHVAGARIVSI
jgi:hypothetical protein